MEKNDNQLLEFLGGLSKMFSSDPRNVREDFYNQIPPEYKDMIDDVLDNPKSYPTDVSQVRNHMYNEDWKSLKNILDKIRRLSQVA